jgi:hypothetical protein
LRATKYADLVLDSLNTSVVTNLCVDSANADAKTINFANTSLIAAVNCVINPKHLDSSA